MIKRLWRDHRSTLRRGVLIALGVMGGLLTTLTFVAAQGAPDFDTSYKVGPRYAETHEMIDYTIVAINRGEPITDVVLSDPVPLGTILVPDTCTYRRSGGPAQPCDALDPMWVEDFDTGDRITTTFSVLVSGGTMQWPLVNCAYLDWGSDQKEMCVTTTLNPAYVYLPLILRNYAPPRPDLQITDLKVTTGELVVGQPVTVAVTVQNVGGAAAGPFWVDLYDNPDPPPTKANQPWNALCSGPAEDCYGIAWHVADGLAAGESVLLSSLRGYDTDQTRWPDTFAESGTHDLYAFADSWNPGVAYGAVEEPDDKEGLDNRLGPVSVDVACDDVLVNGGFESDAAWTLHNAAYVTDTVHAGARSLRTGIPPGASGGMTKTYSSARQQVTLPQATDVRVSYWAYPVNEGDDADDRQYVLLRDEQGVNHWLSDETADTQAWEQRQHDLSAYAGQTVTLFFGSRNDGDDDTTALYVDDAAVRICGLATSTQVQISSPDQRRIRR